MELRLTLEELGPTFIKLGQLMSTRPDLLPPSYIDELGRLLSSSAPVAGAVIVQVVEEELGMPIEDAFASFDVEPLAAASIGQAHVATLRDGTSVVVKVRKPGAVETIRLDVEILRTLAARASRVSTSARDLDLEGLVESFSRTLLDECDYSREADNAERFANDFADTPGVHIPRVFRALSTSRVLTMDRLSGLRVDDVDGLDAAHIDRNSVITRSIDVIVAMVFDNGFFHADPHPGNLFVEADGRIGLIDFGMVGVIGDDDRRLLVALFEALVAADADALARALRSLAPAGDAAPSLALRRDLGSFIADYHGRRLEDVQVGALIGTLLGILRRHHLRVPPTVALLLRMLTVVEGIGLRLDPAFSLGSSLRPAVEKLMVEARSPAALLDRARSSGRQLWRLGRALPENVDELIRTLNGDGLEIHLRARELAPLVTRLERTGDRLVAGLVVSALITGIGSLASGPRGIGWRGPLAKVGIGTIGALGTYLAATSLGRSLGGDRRS
ncbi:AarF/ABC1/UbiB kinase family protein [Frigoribacterium sp. VKM Ac-2530]|uniref:ABC1 kinase family protein n=1 Tax=Frigoribacterium sp. VKM Ac-2530 TaxID=2783822 RepID=UPI00188DAE0F|nr:AarF/ABC1/UbiB kinase family protein [Frigoribacterium sp. VKM Ac-2530]